MDVLLPHQLTVALVLLGSDGERSQVGIVEGHGVDVVGGQIVAFEVEDEGAYAVHRRVGQAEVPQVVRRVGCGGDLVLAAIASVGLLRGRGEDAPVVPGGQAHDVGVVGFVREFVDAGEHVDRVFEIVEAAIRTGPHRDEGLPRLADGLDRSGGAQCSHTADIGGKKPLRCVDDAHTSLRGRVLDASHRIAAARKMSKFRTCSTDHL